MKTVKLDCRGMLCPEPLMMLKNAVRPLEKGDRVEILSDDPVSLRDFPAFCKFMNHSMVSMPDDGHPHLFVIEK
jgi:tRNA 2-thiouridine synthesizing protein A